MSGPNQSPPTLEIVLPPSTRPGEQTDEVLILAGEVVRQWFGASPQPPNSRP